MNLSKAKKLDELLTFFNNQLVYRKKLTDEQFANLQFLIGDGCALCSTSTTGEGYELTNKGKAIAADLSTLGYEPKQRKKIRKSAWSIIVGASSLVVLFIMLKNEFKTTNQYETNEQAQEQQQTQSTDNKNQTALDETDSLRQIRKDTTAINN